MLVWCVHVCVSVCVCIRVVCMLNHYIICYYSLSFRSVNRSMRLHLYVIKSSLLDKVRTHTKLSDNFIIMPDYIAT